MKNKMFRKVLLATILVVAMLVMVAGCSVRETGEAGDADAVSVQFVVEGKTTTSTFDTVHTVTLPKSDKLGYTLDWFIDEAFTTKATIERLLSLGKTFKLYGRYTEIETPNPPPPAVEKVTVSIRFLDRDARVQTVITNLDIDKGSVLPTLDYANITIEGHPEYVITGVDYDGAPILEDKVIMATYEMRQYTLTIVDGATTSTQQVVFGAKAEVSHRESSLAEFVGWVDDEGKEVDFDTFTMPARDVKVEARYNSVDVLSIQTDKPSLTYGDSVTLTAVIDARINKANVCYYKWYKRCASTGKDEPIVNGESESLVVTPESVGMATYIVEIGVTDGDEVIAITHSIDVEVTKANASVLSIRWAEDNDYTYTGAIIQPQFEVVNTLNGEVLDASYYVVTYGDDTHNNIHVAQGIYASVLIKNNVECYEANARICATCDVEPLDITNNANASLQVLLKSDTYTGQQLVDRCVLEVFGTEMNVGGVLAYERDGNAVDVVRDAGEYTLTYTIAKGTEDIYGEITTTFSVAKADIVGVAEDKTFTYDGNMHMLDDIVLSESVEYSVKVDGVPFGGATNAGVYNVVYEYAGSTNYNAFTLETTLTIAKAKSNIVIAADTFAYNGENRLSEVQPSIASGQQLEYASLDMTNAGTYTLDVTALENENYVEIAETFTINITALDAIVRVQDMSLTYDGGDAGFDAKAYDVEGVILGDSLAVTLAVYSGAEQVNAPFDAGTYTVKALVDTNANYNVTAVDGTLTIAPYDITIDDISVTLPSDLTYDGNAKVVIASIAGVASGITITYSGEASAVDAGSYEVVVSSVDMPNYVLSAPISLGNMTINRKSITRPAIASTKVYDGKVFLLEDTLDYTYRYMDHSMQPCEILNVGSYIIEAVLTNANNYQWDDTKVTPCDYSFAVTRKDASNARLSLARGTDLTYTGKEIRPSVDIALEGYEIAKGDYTLAYRDNVNASSHSCVTVTFKGNYEGTASLSFKIAPRQLDKAHGMVVSEISAVTYNGRAHEPKVTVQYAGRVISDRDYRLTYRFNIHAGTGYVDIMMQGNYTGIETVSFEIAKRQVAVTMSAQQIINADSGIKVCDYLAGVQFATDDSMREDVLILLSSDVLAIVDESGADYVGDTLNKEGVYDIVARVENISKDFDLTIAPVSINVTAVDSYISVGEHKVIGGRVSHAYGESNALTIKTTADEPVMDSYTYKVDGKAITLPSEIGTYSIEVTLTSSTHHISMDNVVTFVLDIVKATPTIAPMSVDATFGDTCDCIAATLPLPHVGQQETKGTWTFDDVSPMSAGSVTRAVSFKPEDSTHYNSIASNVTVSVAPLDITAEMVVNVTGNYTYTGSEIEPIVSVSLGGETLGTENYSVTYEDNILAGKGKAIVTMHGNYAGSQAVTFDILEKSIEDAVLSVAAGADTTYTGSEVCPAVDIALEGYDITSDDYTITYESNIVVTESAKAIVTMCGNYTGTKSVTFKIVPKRLDATNGLVVSHIDALTYNGKAHEPVIVVKDGAKTLTTSDYDVAYRDNIDAGTGYVDITMKGNYRGSEVVSFEIGQKVVDETAVSVDNTVSRVYTGALAIVGASDVALSIDGETLSGYTYEVTGGVNAGENIVVSVTLDASGNYTSVAPLELVVGTVAKATLTESIFSGTSYRVEYGTAAGSIVWTTTATYLGMSVGGAYTLADQSDLGVAGTENARVLHFVPADAKNYNEADVDITIQVTKKNIEGATLVIAPQTYDGKAQQVVATLTYEGATIPASEYTITGGADIVDAGTHQIGATLKAEGNYTSGTGKFVANMTVSAYTLESGMMSTSEVGINTKVVTTWTDALLVLSQNINVTALGSEVLGTWTFIDTDPALGYVARKVRFTPNSANYTVLDASVTFVESLIVVDSMTAPALTFNALDQTPAYTTKIGAYTVTSSDYTIAKSTSVNVGKYDAIVTFNAGSGLVGPETDGTLHMVYSIAPYMLTTDKIVADNGSIANFNGNKALVHDLRYKESLSLSTKGWTFQGALEGAINVKLEGITALQSLESIVDASVTAPVIDSTGGTYRWNIKSLNASGNYVLGDAEGIDLYVKVRTLELQSTSTMYTIEEAIGYMNTNGGVVFMLANTRFAEADILPLYGFNNGTIDMTGGTISLPYEALDGTLFKSVRDDAADTNGASGGYALAVTKDYTSVLLTMAGYIKAFNMSGNAVLHLNSARNGNWNGCINRKCGVMNMEKGSKINVTSAGATVDCLGYIIGEGEIEATYGRVNDMLVIGDSAPGGSLKTRIWMDGVENVAIIGKKKQLPFEQFTINNIEVKTTIHYNATYGGHWSLRASDTNFTGVADVLGNTSAALFQFKSTDKNAYIVKSYADYNTYIDLHGDFTTNSVSLELKVVAFKVKIDSSETYMPIPGNFRINLASGNLDMNGEMVLLPGAELRIAEGATFNMGGTLRLYQPTSVPATRYNVLKIYDATHKQVQTTTTGTYPITKNYYRGDAAGTFDYDATTDARLVVDGTMNITGTFGGMITGSKGCTGRVVTAGGVKTNHTFQRFYKIDYAPNLVGKDAQGRMSENIPMQAYLNNGSTKMTAGKTYTAQNGIFA